MPSKITHTKSGKLRYRNSFTVTPAAAPKTLPPDPDRQNDARALWAEAAIEKFEETTGTDRIDALHDLLCDLMHWCDRTGVTFDHELAKARSNYADETMGD